MDEINIVLIAAPEFSTDIAEELKETLPEIFETEINRETKWTIETITDGFTSVAEDDEELLEGVLTLLETKNWDYAVSLTDIPLFHKKEIMLAQVNHAYKFGLVSLPTTGWFVKKRITNIVLKVVEEIYYADINRPEEEPEERKNAAFYLGNIDKITDEKESKYIFSSRLYGLITILFGMTYDNQPWTIMPSLKTTIAVAFGSGAYAMIFPTLWMMSDAYNPWRLVVLMVLAIFGLVIWMIQGHNLWEKKTPTKSRKYRTLYNATTIFTLFIAVSLFYLILTTLFLGTAFIFVEPSYYVEQTESTQLPNFLNYLQLAWMAASVGTITGAVGVGLEDEENVRQKTYGYRQRERYRILEESKEEDQE